MLFLQGTRDGFARLDLITDVTSRLKSLATLHLVDGADHSFGVPKRAARSPEQVMDELAEAIVAWARALSGSAAEA